MMLLHDPHAPSITSPSISPDTNQQPNAIPLSIHSIIARQDTGNITNIPDSLRPKPHHTALPPWQIIIIVIGTLLFISLLAILFLRIRTSYRIKRGASTTQFGASFTGDGADGFMNGRKGKEDSGVAGSGKRESMVGEAKVKIRKLIKKTKPAGSTRGMEMTPNTDGKTGFNFSLSPTGFGGDTNRSKRKSHLSSRIKSDDMDSGPGLGKDEVGRGPFHFHAHTNSNSRSFIGTGSGLTSIGREEDVDHGFNSRSPGSHGIGPGGPGRGRHSDDWDYDTHSVAHTIRDSLDDDRDQETETAVGTSAPVSASPFTSPTRNGDFDPYSSSHGHSYTSYGLGRGSPREHHDLMDARRYGHDRGNRI